MTPVPQLIIFASLNLFEKKLGPRMALMRERVKKIIFAKKVPLPLSLSFSTFLCRFFLDEVETDDQSKSLVCKISSDILLAARNPTRQFSISFEYKRTLMLFFKKSI